MELISSSAPRVSPGQLIPKLLKMESQTKAELTKRNLVKKVRRGYLLNNAYELLIAVVALLTSVAFFIDPAGLLAGTAIGTELLVWAFAWNLGYGLGALLIIYGLYAINTRYEVAGLSLFSAAVIINVAVLIASFGFASLISEGIFVAFAIAAGIRAWIIIRHLYGAPGVALIANQVVGLAAIKREAQEQAQAQAREEANGTD